jgi:hypothetical protein
MNYRIQQKATVWIETTVEADNLEQALLAADEQINNGDFREDPASFELVDEFWWEDEQGESGTI